MLFVHRLASMFVPIASPTPAARKRRGALDTTAVRTRTVIDFLSKNVEREAVCDGFGGMDGLDAAESDDEVGIAAKSYEAIGFTPVRAAKDGLD